MYPITASQLLINTLLIYKASSIFPFLMQVYLLCTFFFIYYPSKKNTQSVQFEIWMYFLISIIFPFSLYAVAGFSLLLVNPFQYIFHLLILVTFPTAVFLGLLSFRYFSWLSWDWQIVMNNRPFHGTITIPQVSLHPSSPLNPFYGSDFLLSSFIYKPYNVVCMYNLSSFPRTLSLPSFHRVLLSCLF